MRKRYEILKKIAKETLLNFNDGQYYSYEADFDTTRRYPYPILRYLIAMELYNIPCSTLQSIGELMGIKHSTLSIGIRKTECTTYLNDIRIIKEFRNNIARFEEIESRLDPVWKLDDDRAMIYILISQETSNNVSDWYEENDDLSHLIMTQ